MIHEKELELLEKRQKSNMGRVKLVLVFMVVLLFMIATLMLTKG